MIFRVPFGISKTTKCTRPTGSCTFVGLCKIYLCLFIPNCNRNHVITYTDWSYLHSTLPGMLATLWQYLRGKLGIFSQKSRAILGLLFRKEWRIQLTFLPLLSKQRDTYSNEILVYGINDIDRKGIMHIASRKCLAWIQHHWNLKPLAPQSRNFKSTSRYLLAWFEITRPITPWIVLQYSLYSSGGSVVWAPGCHAGGRTPAGPTLRVFK